MHKESASAEDLRGGTRAIGTAAMGLSGISCTGVRFNIRVYALAA
jgi:hypothetical protein